jgi:hypothetical protein
MGVRFSLPAPFIMLDKFYGQKDLEKTVRILVYPNITWQKDLEKDSYVQVLKNMIRETQGEPFFWHIISPIHIDGLTFPNTEQLMVSVPSYPPAMRSHFDVSHVKSLIGADKDFDIIMSHLPEHTHQLVNTMYNLTHHTPKVMGYTHWFDFNHIVAWYKGAFNQNMLGLLEYENCYINTYAQKEMVLEQAKEVLNTETVNRIDNILTVQHLGVFESDIVEPNESPEKVIVFNHRCEKYKHFDEFVSLMDKLYETRQDFKVWIPLFEGDVPRDYMTNEKFDKKGYYNRLRDCLVGFAPQQKYGGWSVAATDGLMNGVPYIFYDGSYYHELQDNGEFFTTDDEALTLLNTYLDNVDHRNEQSKIAQQSLRDNLLYKNEMTKMVDNINAIVDVTPYMGESEKLEEMIELIRTHKSITKRELHSIMGWGRGIKWTPYRRALLLHPNIYDTMSVDPTYNWKE